MGNCITAPFRGNYQNRSRVRRGGWRGADGRRRLHGWAGLGWLGAGAQLARVGAQAVPASAHRLTRGSVGAGRGPDGVSERASVGAMHRRGRQLFAQAGKHRRNALLQRFDELLVHFEHLL